MKRISRRQLFGQNQASSKRLSARPASRQIFSKALPKDLKPDGYEVQPQNQPLEYEEFRKIQNLLSANKFELKLRMNTVSLSGQESSTCQQQKPEILDESQRLVSNTIQMVKVALELLGKLEFFLFKEENGEYVRYLQNAKIIEGFLRSVDSWRRLQLQVGSGSGHFDSGTGFSGVNKKLLAKIDTNLSSGCRLLKQINRLGCGSVRKKKKWQPSGDTLIYHKKEPFSLESIREHSVNKISKTGQKKIPRKMSNLEDQRNVENIKSRKRLYKVKKKEDVQSSMIQTGGLKNGKGSEEGHALRGFQDEGKENMEKREQVFVTFTDLKVQANGISHEPGFCQFDSFGRLHPFQYQGNCVTGKNKNVSTFKKQSQAGLEFQNMKMQKDLKEILGREKLSKTNHINKVPQIISEDHLTAQIQDMEFKKNVFREDFKKVDSSIRQISVHSLAQNISKSSRNRQLKTSIQPKGYLDPKLTPSSSTSNIFFIKTENNYYSPQISVSNFQNQEDSKDVHRNGGTSPINNTNFNPNLSRQNMDNSRLRHSCSNPSFAESVQTQKSRCSQRTPSQKLFSRSDLSSNSGARHDSLDRHSDLCESGKKPECSTFSSEHRGNFSNASNFHLNYSVNSRSALGLEPSTKKTKFAPHKTRFSKSYLNQNQKAKPGNQKHQTLLSHNSQNEKRISQNFEKRKIRNQNQKINLRPCLLEKGASKFENLEVHMQAPKKINLDLLYQNRGGVTDKYRHRGRDRPSGMEDNSGYRRCSDFVWNQYQTRSASPIMRKKVSYNCGDPRILKIQEKYLRQGRISHENASNQSTLYPPRQSWKDGKFPEQMLPQSRNQNRFSKIQKFQIINQTPKNNQSRSSQSREYANSLSRSQISARLGIDSENWKQCQNTRSLSPSTPNRRFLGRNPLQFQLKREDLRRGQRKSTPDRICNFRRKDVPTVGEFRRGAFKKVESGVYQRVKNMVMFGQKKGVKAAVTVRRNKFQK